MRFNYDISMYVLFNYTDVQKISQQKHPRLFNRRYDVN